MCTCHASNKGARVCAECGRAAPYNATVHDAPTHAHRSAPDPRSGWATLATYRWEGSSWPSPMLTRRHADITTVCGALPSCPSSHATPPRPATTPLRCQDATNRLIICFKVQEGQAGALQAYVVPAIPPKTCCVVQYRWAYAFRDFS